MSSPVPLAIDRAAPVERVELDDGSWIDIVRGIIIDPESLAHVALTSWSWRQETHFRYEVTVSRERRIASLADHSTPAAVRQLAMHLDATYQVRFSGPGIFLYPDGDVTMGYHRDREMRWLDDTLIAILSLGATRPLGFRPRNAPYGDPAHERHVELASGDLLVMGGRFQQDWLHGVPRVPGAGPRMSLTWRWSSRSGEPDSSEAYSAPRHFSDAPRGRTGGGSGARRRPPTTGEA